MLCKNVSKADCSPCRVAMVQNLLKIVHPFHNKHDSINAKTLSPPSKRCVGSKCNMSHVRP